VPAGRGSDRRRRLDAVRGSAARVRRHRRDRRGRRTMRRL
jgi:hypothetical protein